MRVFSWILTVSSFKAADLLATEALYRSPSLLKARYRRGLARKDLGTVDKLKLAMEGTPMFDSELLPSRIFSRLQQLFEARPEAVMQYKETSALLLTLRVKGDLKRLTSDDDSSSQEYSEGSAGSAGGQLDNQDEESSDGDSDSDNDTTGPLYTLSNLETEVKLDSDDHEHEGKYACKDYNRLGCQTGRECIIDMPPMVTAQEIDCE